SSDLHEADRGARGLPVQPPSGRHRRGDQAHPEGTSHRGQSCQDDGSRGGGRGHAPVRGRPHGPRGQLVTGARGNRGGQRRRHRRPDHRAHRGQRWPLALRASGSTWYLVPGTPPDARGSGGPLALFEPGAADGATLLDGVATPDPVRLVGEQGPVQALVRNRAGGTHRTSPGDGQRVLTGREEVDVWIGETCRRVSPGADGQIYWSHGRLLSVWGTG